MLKWNTSIFSIHPHRLHTCACTNIWCGYTHTYDRHMPHTSWMSIPAQHAWYKLSINIHNSHIKTHAHMFTIIFAQIHTAQEGQKTTHTYTHAGIPDIFLMLHLIIIKTMPFLPETRSSFQTFDTGCSLSLASQMHPSACEAAISPMLGMWWMTQVVVKGIQVLAHATEPRCHMPCWNQCHSW